MRCKDQHQGACRSQWSYHCIWHFPMHMTLAYWCWNWISSGGSVVVKVSSTFLSNFSPVSPGANVMLNCCVMLDTAMRRLNMDRFLPGQLYRPVKVVSQRFCWKSNPYIIRGYQPREKGRNSTLSVPISSLLSPQHSGINWCASLQYCLLVWISCISTKTFTSLGM